MNVRAVNKLLCIAAALWLALASVVEAGARSAHLVDCPLSTSHSFDLDDSHGHFQCQCERADVLQALASGISSVDACHVVPVFNWPPAERNRHIVLPAEPPNLLGRSSDPPECPPELLPSTRI